MMIKWKEKGLGFYLSVGLIAANVIAAIAYAVGYASSIDWSWLVISALAASVLVGIALLLTGKLKYYASVSFVTILIAIGAFVMSTFNYMVDAYVGIDVTELSASFIGCTVLLIAIFVLSFVNNLIKTE